MGNTFKCGCAIMQVKKRRYRHYAPLRHNAVFRKANGMAKFTQNLLSSIFECAAAL